MGQSFKLAIKAIISNKMRAFLTMLGIIIGVAAVIILVSVVSGYMGQIIESFEEMGANRITIFARATTTRRVTEDDIYGFWDKHPDWISGISPTVSISNPVIKSGNESLDETTVTGVSEDYSDIMSIEIEDGRNLTYSDMIRRANVAIVGKYVAIDLYGTAEKALEETIKINGKPFTIVGVAEYQDEDSFEEGGEDDFIWIPYTYALKINRNGYITNFTMTSTDTDYTDDIVSSLQSELYKIYKSSNYYRVTAMSSIIDELNKQVGTLTAMLAGIAGISLLVAGIGVMNIMLVSVTERTREIGIRKALGARQSVIMQQFVIEATVTSMIGGVIGIIIGGFATSSIGAAMGITCSPTFGSVMLSFSVSVLIGVLFGYLPAKNAARLDPIEALRVD